jgi:hypothetical protein
MNSLVIRKCYASRSNTLKSWILEKVNGWLLSTAIKHAHFKRGEFIYLNMS